MTASTPQDDATSPSPSDAVAVRPRPIRWFLLAFFVYAATVYGQQLRWWAIFKPTRPHHHVAQAQAWLDGRLHLDPSLNLQDLSPVDGVPHSSSPPGPTILLLISIDVLYTFAWVWYWLIR